jgi:hypothetical protein
MAQVLTCVIHIKLRAGCVQLVRQQSGALQANLFRALGEQGRGGVAWATL